MTDETNFQENLVQNDELNDLKPSRPLEDFKLSKPLDTFSKCIKVMYDEKLISKEDISKVEYVLRSMLSPPTKYAWLEDADFLFIVLKENINRYFRFKIEAEILMYIRHDRKEKFILDDKIIYKAAEDIVVLTLSGMSTDYINILLKYFNSMDDLVNYIHHKITDELMELSIEYNTANDSLIRLEGTLNKLKKFNS